MTFGKRIRELRHAKELSFGELAAKVDVGFTYLSRVRAAEFRRLPSRCVVPPISRRFGSRRGGIADPGEASAGASQEAISPAA